MTSSLSAAGGPGPKVRCWPAWSSWPSRRSRTVTISNWSKMGASSDIKRFVLKVHSNRIVGIALWLERGHAFANVEEIGRSKYRVMPGGPISADFPLVDDQWMADTLQELLTRIQF